MGTERNGGLGTQDLEANTELRYSAFSRVKSAVVPFEVREGMEGEQTPEMDLTRHHRVLGEGDKFESSFLRLNRCCFLALLRVDIHLLWDLWNDLRLPLVGFAFQEENVSCFKVTTSPQDSVYQGREEGNDT